MLLSLQKINMKGRHIKILTIFGLIAIIALQTIWLCNAYIQFSQSIYKDSNDILKKSLNRKLLLDLKTPKGTMINGAPIKDSNEIVRNSLFERRIIKTRIRTIIN